MQAILSILIKRIKKYFLVLFNVYPELKISIKTNYEWFGNEYGGFFVATDFVRDNSVIYSIGTGEDISFDLEIFKRYGTRIFMFDPTPKSSKYISELDLPADFSFHEFGIGSKTSKLDFYLPKNHNHVSGSIHCHSGVSSQEKIQVSLMSFPDICSALGHVEVDILKLDIEGAEYEVIDSILNSGIKVTQILVEIHERFFVDGRSKTIKFLDLLEKNGYKIFAISDSFEEISLLKSN